MQLVGVVGVLPREVAVGATEVAVGRGALVDRPAQVEALDDRGRAQVEHARAPAPASFSRVDLRRAERLDHDRHRVRDADRVRDLHLAPLGEPGGDDVFATWRTAYAAERSTLVGSLPENAPPPWRAMPP